MYKEKTTKGFGDIAITNKGNSEFLIKVKEFRKICIIFN